jgi:hypothetical protein
MPTSPLDKFLANVDSLNHAKLESEKWRARFRAALGEGLISKPMLLAETERALKEDSKARGASLNTLKEIIFLLPGNELEKKIIELFQELYILQGKEETDWYVREEGIKYFNK